VRPVRIRKNPIDPACSSLTHLGAIMSRVADFRSYDVELAASDSHTQFKRGGAAIQSQETVLASASRLQARLDRTCLEQPFRSMHVGRQLLLQLVSHAPDSAAEIESWESLLE
jgi:hypothetical protein